MKKGTFLILILSFFLFTSTVTAQSNLSTRDIAIIENKIQILVSAFNNKDKEIIYSSIFPSQKVLIKEVKEKIGEEMNVKVEYSLTNGKIFEMENGDIKIMGKVFSSGKNWKVNGRKVFFIVRQIKDDWFVVDTDIHEKIGSEYITNVIKKVFLITIPILLVYCVLWIWMLVDCFKRDIKDKALWIFLLLIIPFSCIYYLFAIKRKKTIIKSEEVESI